MPNPNDLAKATVSAAGVLGGGDSSAGVLTKESAGPLIHAVHNSKDANVVVPVCPNQPLPKYHDEEVCQLSDRVEFEAHSAQRSAIYEKLRASGNGATLVPNQQTVTCPRQPQSLENPSHVKGFDSTWMVENTASTPVLLSWVVDGVEWSPFHPDVLAVDDPDAMLQVGDWKAVPTFESFVYHVREIDQETGGPGDILLQHRAGLIPLGNPQGLSCDASLPDVEPVNPDTGETLPNVKRTPTHKFRRCNTMDIGFRNQAGCPLHVYWASFLDSSDLPSEGFSCGEKFRLHLGTNHASQDFFSDWQSATKFEGSFLGHTFVARLASNPDVVVDSYTLKPTRIVDCPNLKQVPIEAGRAKDEAIEVQQGETVGDQQQDEASTSTTASIERNGPSLQGVGRAAGATAGMSSTGGAGEL